MKARHLFAGVAVLSLLAAATASAQQAQRVRGTIASADGSSITVKQAEGADVTVKLADNVLVFGVVPAKLADIKAGDYVGVGAQPQPDGSQKAIQIMIFAESQRGTGEGFRPWDRPGTTMTNGTVNTTAAGVSGQTLTVKYKDGEQKIVVSPEAAIRAYVVGTKAELKPGAQIAIVRADKAADGTLSTGRVNVGRDGVVPQ
jgi:ABC-type enterochelin transport system substrate-binding protein